MSRPVFRAGKAIPLAQLDGWRVLFPVLPLWFGRRYDIDTDEFLRGWWVLALSLAVDRYGHHIVNGRDYVHGLGVRMHWGLISTRLTSAAPSVQQAKAAS